MSTRRFVSGSSIILAGWLGATFLNDVPEMKYPKLDKQTETSALPKADENMIAARQGNDRVAPSSAWH